ncbi:MAG: sulfite exporter TauE/SafE family protein [Planctomycetaceae bacterium]|jgi:uncharacterized membrane protein YfcA|nr:sulfite exporter TauE/SafE family protein [Planctomycetaceae bacterium]
MIFLLFVGDLSCPELASNGTPFEHRSTGATARRAGCPPANDFIDTINVILIIQMAIFIGLIAALFFGMSKTGVPGLGILGVIVMLSAFNGEEKLSTGAVLPLLVIADSFAVFYYWRGADLKRIVFMLPSVFIGIIAGTFFLWLIDDYVFKIFLSVLVICLVLFELFRKWMRLTSVPKSAFFARTMGFLAGFTTQAGNAAGPVMSIYLAAQNMNKKDFMGTFAVFFFIINITKLPLIGGLVPGLNMINQNTIMLDLMLLPGLLVGVLIGRRVFILVPERYFVPMIMCLNLLVPVVILISG